jgi:hypothetical protein
MSTKLKPTKKARPIDPEARRDEHTISLRLSLTERVFIDSHARKYAGGNVSEWVRYAALNFKPTKEDFEK